MSSILSNNIWLKLDVLRPDDVRDELTALIPRLVAGATIELNVLLKQGSLVLSPSNFSSVTFKLSPFLTPSVPALTKTISSFTSSVTEGQFEDRTHRHFTVTLTAEDTNLAEGTYFMSMVASTTVPSTINIVDAPVVVLEKNTGRAVSADNPQLSIPKNFLNSKGQLISHDGTSIVRVSPGLNGQLLKADPSSPTGFAWQTVGAGTGDVVGPVTATSNAIARFDGSTGKVIKNSSVTINDSGVVSSSGLSVVGDIVVTGTVDGRDVSADGTKLDGIAPGADVTNSTTVAAAGALMATNNLSDLANAGTARTNLGLGSAATSSTGDFAPASHTHTTSAITDITAAGAALATAADAAAQRTALGLGSASTEAASAFLQPSNNLSDVANAGTARTNLGLGSAATASTGDFAAASHTHTTAAITDITSAGAALATAADASAQRTALGLGTIATQAANNVDITGGSVTGLSAVSTTDVQATGSAGLVIKNSSGATIAEFGAGGGSNATMPATNMESLALTTDLAVTHGGTGLSSATAYAVLCGGTTSTGAFQSIASVGTSGQVLTSNGTGALPTFQTIAAGGGSYELISDTSIATGSSQVISGLGSTSYDTYEILLHGVRVASNSGLSFDVSVDGGSTYLAGTNYAGCFAHRLSSGATDSFNTAGAATMTITTGAYVIQANATHGGGSFKIRLYNSGTSVHRMFDVVGAFAMNDGANQVSMNGGGRIKTNSKVTHFRLNGVSADLTGGRIILYGLKHS